jgi:hypothetical protein
MNNRKFIKIILSAIFGCYLITGNVRADEPVRISPDDKFHFGQSVKYKHALKILIKRSVDSLTPLPG